MKKSTYTTTDIVSFEPHEWKQISDNPVIYEALKDEIILKIRDYKISDDEKMQRSHRIIINKGEQVEVSIVGTKFQLSFDVREFRTGETIDYDMEL